VTAGVMLASAGAVAAAQGTGGTSWTVNPSLNERFTIFGGAAFTTVDAKVSTFNKNTGTNEGSIDLDDIGFDSDDVSPLAGGRWRFGSKRNWTIALSYFGNRGSGDSVLDTSFTYEGVTYTVGGTVSSELNTDILIGMIGWAPFKSEKYELGFGVGAHVADLEVKFAGAGIVSGSPVGSVTTKEDVLAPLPNISGSTAATRSRRSSRSRAPSAGSASTSASTTASCSRPAACSSTACGRTWGSAPAIATSAPISRSTSRISRTSSISTTTARSST
jgi:hypothetical protein